MNPALYVFGGLTLAWMAYMGYLWRATQAIRGRPLEDSLRRHPPELERHGERALLYQDEEGHPVIKVDLGRHSELAETLGIRATPTLLRVEHGQVQAVALGSKSRRQIPKLLES